MSAAKSINLNHFIKLDKINEENFLATYKTKEKKTKQLYAAILFDVSEISTNLILTGINIHSTISHPAIIKFIGYSQTDFENNSNPVVVTELATNGTLQNLIDKSNDKRPKFGDPWDFTKKFINIYGIASAMSYLHKKGIIYRYLNPNNILMDKDLYPMVSNFIFSKFSNDLDSDDEIPELAYDAPEILKGEDYSEASDVYSFGIIIYQIISCIKSLKSSSSIFNVSNKIVRGEKPEISPNTPAIYAQLIKRCWSHNPFDRPTFEEIATLLKEDQGFLLQDDSIDNDEIRTYIEFVDSSSRNNECPQPRQSQKRLIKPKVLIEQNSDIDQKSVESSSSRSNISSSRTPSRRFINPDVFSSKEVDMPKLIEQLKAENESLKKENASLKRETSELREENDFLRKQLSQKFTAKKNNIF